MFYIFNYVGEIFDIRCATTASELPERSTSKLTARIVVNI